MPNPYYTRTFDVVPGSTISSQRIEDEFESIEVGLDGVDSAIDAKASKAGDTYTGAHDFSGASVTVPTPTAPAHPATKAYADALTFAAALPGQTGNAGKTIRTDGTTAAWQPEGGAVTVVSGTTQTAVTGNQYVLTNASASTLTLPASPSAGDTVIVSIGNSRTDNVIARNGSTVMGLAEDMTVDNANATVTLRYLNSSWRLV